MFEGGHREVVKKTVAAWAAAPRALRPTALFALHPPPILDGLLARELARHGLKIPRDLSVITTTWGGQFFGGASTKIDGLKYSAIDFDLAALVKRAFDAAEAVSRDDAPPGKRSPRLSFAPAKLNGGKSTAPPPKS
jgi:hypothetical protein